MSSVNGRGRLCHEGRRSSRWGIAPLPGQRGEMATHGTERIHDPAATPQLLAEIEPTSHRATRVVPSWWRNTALLPPERIALRRALALPNAIRSPARR